ncbi:hypothetical protein H7R39_09670 [Campylobacter sp. Marseille-Q3452]|uniref:Uncharacterized protein n=1 Tax=Campylobacter massiliensis TaxID=2762557 RepID=A0A842JEQ8_9BACT|nr:hypothetical protein [Campylobacter massiliensis]MBC2883514.1 hypothetical protein [Campylobacter massiliensis]
MFKLFSAAKIQRVEYWPKISSKFTQDFCRFRLQILRPQDSRKFNPKGGKCPF